MGLNKSKGNMYDFVTHTWNTVKGSCPHDCGYCYMKRWGKQNPPCLDRSEFKTDLGSGNFIFVGSSNDLFAAEHPKEWILATLKHLEEHDNRYLLQSKNPARILDYIDTAVISEKAVICTTIETNRYYPEFMSNCPLVDNRADAMNIISEVVKSYVTIEPVMDFDLPEMVELIKRCNPVQVNIGADTGHNYLPEPPKEKVLELIAALEEFATVKQKSNLNRLLK
jgi:DNA repair photolyase